MSIVTTKQELEAAKGRGDAEIIVKGDLADQLKTSKTITMVGGGAIAAVALAFGAATLTAPVTGGRSYLVAAPIAALSGMEIAAIIAISAIGLTLVLAVFKDYEEISYSSGSLVLKRRQSNGGDK